MLKSITPEVAKVVGKSASLLLNQMAYLFKSWGRDKIYRTNKQLVDDLEGLLSESTIKRSKNKLIDAGLISVSFDRGVNRQTFYSLTNKAKAMLSHLVPEWAIFKENTDGGSNTAETKNNAIEGLKTQQKRMYDGNVSGFVKDTVEKQENAGDYETIEVLAKEELDSRILSKNKSDNQKPNSGRIDNKDKKPWYSGWNKKKVSEQDTYMPNGETKQMKESFKEGFSNANSKPMPETLRNMFRGKNRKQSIDHSVKSVSSVVKTEQGLKNSFSVMDDFWFDSFFELDCLADSLTNN